MSDLIRAIRAAAGLFRLTRRGLICVEGGDRVRWLDGMLSNDIASLEPGPQRSGCPALLLTRTGRIQADPQVLILGDDLWLELDGDAVRATLATLEKFIIADDVRLRDGSADVERLALEGPQAARIVDELAGRALGLARDAAIRVELAGVDCVVGAWGVSGMEARQLFVPSGSGEPVIRALLEVGAPWGLVEADPDSLEILRIEAGVPRLGAELDEEVLPPEARLERALSFDKGCYRGQEIVARLASHGGVKHFLVGFVCDGDEPPEVDTPVHSSGESSGESKGESDGRAPRRIGEVTSSCRSPSLGPIALGYARQPHDQPGTLVQIGNCRARVSALPFHRPEGRPERPPEPQPD